MTSPTWIISTLDWSWSLNSPPKSTRNISGKITAKKTEVLSRRKPLRIATEIALNAIMRGTPVR